MIEKTDRVSSPGRPFAKNGNSPKPYISLKFPLFLLYRLLFLQEQGPRPPSLKGWSLLPASRCPGGLPPFPPGKQGPSPLRLPGYFYRGRCIFDNLNQSLLYPSLPLVL